MTQKNLIFVTSKPRKVEEASAILDLPITGKSYELEEIQTLDLNKIIEHKLLQAFEIFKAPVIVDDVSAELESLNGLPGPFIRFFEEKLGEDALYQLSKVKNDKVKIICNVGFFDGKKQVIARGILTGKIVPPRGSNGWGFDKVVVPDGHELTMGEMESEEKNSLSYRYLALSELAKKLKGYN